MMNNFLCFPLDFFQKEATHRGYLIRKMEALNAGVDASRVVRVQEISPKVLNILIAYEKQLIINK